MDDYFAARFIRKRREELGFSQEDLARLCGVSQQTISRFESGERFPSVLTLWRLSLALDAEPSDFFEWGEFDCA
ncbi:helix-turn-helix transcriptional regulator [Streptomyces sp. NRRL B-1347]|uniref:helix-turn-helix transcriptional regulator n=1 Tax=Streptomyces sp. NRRL B-1347 TaxID=1476877 RepID=UPI00055C634C|nr:helix-turn-helix transcriptional regulator [Streptomyces sp. NRRL B-1347]